MITLFMDFETFGEHQWQDTGIFDFFTAVVDQIVQDPYSEFKTPSELLAKKHGWQVYDVPEPISWADVDRDLTAWRGNELQWDTLRLIYDLEKNVLATKNTKLIDDWRKLQTSDHFYYMCTKWSADGDVHAYFSPYDSPLEAYNRYCNVVADLKGRLTSSKELFDA
jgi:alpha-amylase